MPSREWGPGWCPNTWQRAPASADCAASGAGLCLSFPNTKWRCGWGSWDPSAFRLLLQPTPVSKHRRSTCLELHWWMLSGNHGNRQVSVSLPLPVTLRCHHVLVTSRAPHVPHRRSPGCPSVLHRAAVAAGLCRGLPSPPRCTSPIQVSNTARLCRGSPGPRGQDPVPWGGGGNPTSSCHHIPVLAASLPGGSPASRTKQHLQALNHAAGPALPKIAHWRGLPCQH